MKRRHFLKALAAVGGAVTLAPRLAMAATLEEATRPYVIQVPALPAGIRQFMSTGAGGTYVKVSDVGFMPVTLPSDDPLSRYDIQGWKASFLATVLR